MHDWRDAYRSLRAAPMVSLFAILSLSLGIGSIVAVFSIANALLLTALPVHEPERLALVASSGDGRRSYWATHAAWEQIRHRHLFERAFAWSHKKLNLSERGEAQLVDALLASEDFHDVLGVHPILGRGLSPGDESVAILSHEFWMRRFGGSRDVLGQTLRLDREPFTVIVNRSINQTLSRTILTSGLTFLTVVVLFLMGGQVLRTFSFALTVGIVIGTYSSFGIAVPFVVAWNQWRGRGSLTGASSGTGGRARQAEADRERPMAANVSRASSARR